MSDLQLIEAKIADSALASVEIRDAEIQPSEITAWASMASRHRCAIALRLPTSSIPPLGYALNAARTPFDLIFNEDEEFSYIILNANASPGYLWRLSGILPVQAESPLPDYLKPDCGEL